MATTTTDRNSRDDHTESLIIVFVTFVILFLSGILVYVLIPASKPFPSFTIHDLNLYAFNFSADTSTLTSKLQVTISSKNDVVVDSAAIHLDKIDFYASYRNQQITLPTSVPPTYLDVLDATVWAPYLNGIEAPVNPDLVASLAHDVDSGAVLINVKATLQLRSVFRSKDYMYGLKVNCPVYVTLRDKTNVVGSAVERPFVEKCRVEWL